jgi:hypothetical protein
MFWAGHALNSFPRPAQCDVSRPVGDIQIQGIRMPVNFGSVYSSSAWGSPSRPTPPKG